MQSNSARLLKGSATEPPEITTKQCAPVNCFQGETQNTG